jgi:hypothetical protein
MKNKTYCEKFAYFSSREIDASIDASLLAMCERATAKLRRDLKKQKRKK